MEDKNLYYSTFQRENRWDFFVLVLYYFVFLQKNKIVKMDKPKNRIKEVLEERSFKQAWLAEKLGKSFCIVNSYVCNRRKPSLEVLFEMAKILNVEPERVDWETMSIRKCTIIDY